MQVDKNTCIGAKGVDERPVIEGTLLNEMALVDDGPAIVNENSKLGH